MILSSSRPTLGNNHSILTDIQDELDADRTKQFKEVFNKAISKKKNSESDNLIEKLSVLAAYEEMNSFLIKCGLKYIAERQPNEKDKTEQVSDFKWKNITSVDFVQIIYGLFHAGILTNEKNEITRLVSDAAKSLRFNLSDNWQILLSENVNSRNADYQPKIFQNAGRGFDEYRNTQIEKNRKNKLK